MDVIKRLLNKLKSCNHKWEVVRDIEDTDIHGDIIRKAQDLRCSKCGDVRRDYIFTI